MKRDFSNGAAWSTAASWLEQTAAAITFLVIAKLIGVESFGIISMAFAFLFLGEYLVRDTITESIIERKSLEEGRLEATFAVQTGIALALVLTLIIVAPIVAKIYDEPTVAPLLIAACPTVLMIGVAGVSTALLRRKMAYKTIAIRIVAGVVVGGLVGITMAMYGFGAWSLVGQRLAEIGFNSVLAIKAAGWRPKKWPRRSDFALLRGLGPNAIKLRAITIIITQTPTVMLGILADPRAVGLFAFAWRLAEIVLSVSIKPLQGVAQSAIAAFRRQQRDTSQFFIDLTELAAFIGFSAFTGLALIAYPLTGILLGPEWSDASAILPFICLANSVTALTSVQEAYLLAMDKLKPFLAVAAIEAVLGLVVISLASRYGPVVAAGVVALRALVSLPLRTAAALMAEAIAPRRFVGALATPMLVTAGIAAAVGLWRHTTLDSIPGTIYVASAILVGILTAGIILFGLMPNTVARLRTFTEVKE